jgi:thiol-disulfide isomerase/thioredoxin
MALWSVKSPKPAKTQQAAADDFTMAFFEANALKPKQEVWVIDFWASWCGPCIRVIPELRRIQAAYAAKGVRFISISVDESEADWLRAREHHPMPWHHLRHTGRSPRDFINRNFRFTAIPTLFLITPEGKIRRMQHPQSVEVWLENHFAKSGK